jgi:hypothetical protein
VLVGAGAHALELEMLEFFAATGDEPRYVAPKEPGGGEGDEDEDEEGEGEGEKEGAEGGVR